jgi:hypothetical protein
MSERNARHQDQRAPAEGQRKGGGKEAGQLPAGLPNTSSAGVMNALDTSVTGISTPEAAALTASGVADQRPEQCPDRAHREAEQQQQQQREPGQRAGDASPGAHALFRGLA